MSCRLEHHVWNSSLPRRLKWIALYLAYLADNDGMHIYPSVGKICKRVCLSRRSVQQGLAELRADGIIVPLGQSKGGRSRFVNYRIVVSKLPRETAKGSNGEVKPDTSAAPFSAKTVQPVAPFFPERGNLTAPFDASHSSGSVDRSYNYPDTTPSHPLEGMYPSRGNHTIAGGETPSESSKQGDDLGLGVETDHWLKETWGKAKRNLKFPITALPNLLAAEVRFGNRAFRRAWLAFLAEGVTGVQQFLRSLGTGPPQSSSFQVGSMVQRPSVTAAVPAAPRQYPRRKNRKTMEEINQHVLARVRQNLAAGGEM